MSAKHSPTATRPCARCGRDCATGGNTRTPVCSDCRATDSWWLVTTGVKAIKPKPTCPVCEAGTYDPCCDPDTGKTTQAHKERRQLMRQEQAA